MKTLSVNSRPLKAVYVQGLGVHPERVEGRLLVKRFNGVQYRVKQQGAVLAFTLIMLTLLTLAGVNMISQNKQELMMATNARQQVKALATVEQLVSQAENAIENDTTICTFKDKGGGQMVKAPLVAGSRPTGMPDEATIMSVSCLKADTGSDKNEYLCSSVLDQYTVGISSTPYCYPTGKLPNELCTITNGVPTNTSSSCDKRELNPSPDSCERPIYTIRVTSTDTITNAKRTVESRYKKICP